MPKIVLPNAHIVGVQKAATTSLFYWLGQHEEIYAPLAAKDYPFFADDDFWKLGINEYAKLFTEGRGSKVVLAGSVHTLHFSYARERLQQTFPKSKLIIVLRDPVERILSAYNYRVKCGVEQLEFIDSLKQECVRLKNSSFEKRAGGAYLSHGFYFDQIKSLMDLFSPEQLQVVLFDDIRDTPELVLKELFNFLNVNIIYNPTLEKRNVTGRVRNRLLFKLCFGKSKIRNWVVRNFVGKIFSLKQRTHMRHWLKEINTAPSKPNVPSGFCRSKLIPRYIEDINRLEILLNRDLSSWKRW